jgi:hypothetical protein
MMCWNGIEIVANSWKWRRRNCKRNEWNINVERVLLKKPLMMSDEWHC